MCLKLSPKKTILLRDNAFMQKAKKFFSLFCFHLSGDGYALSHFILNTVSSPKFVPLTIMILNPEHLVVVLVIPFYQLMKKYLS